MDTKILNGGGGADVWVCVRRGLIGSRAIVGSACLLSTCLALSAEASPVPRYRVLPVETQRKEGSFPSSLNAHGEVLFQRYGSTSLDYVVWSPERAHRVLSVPQGIRTHFGSSLSDSGHVVGGWTNSTLNHEAVFWDPQGNPIKLQSVGADSIIYESVEYDAPYALHVIDDGTIYGRSTLYRLIRWNDASQRASAVLPEFDLTYLFGERDVNNSGHGVGSYYTGGLGSKRGTETGSKGADYVAA